METFFGDVLDWSALNLMNINVTKTKEMIVGVNVNPPPQLVYSDETVGRVLCCELPVADPGGHRPRPPSQSALK